MYLVCLVFIRKLILPPYEDTAAEMHKVDVKVVEEEEEAGPVPSASTQNLSNKPAEKVGNCFDK